MLVFRSHLRYECRSESDSDLEGSESEAKGSRI